MGEVLHEVDFNQLKIENQQYLEKIDEKNQDLLRLKLMDGNVQQILNTYKVHKVRMLVYKISIQCGGRQGGRRATVGGRRENGKRDLQIGGIQEKMRKNFAISCNTS